MTPQELRDQARDKAKMVELLSSTNPEAILEWRQLAARVDERNKIVNPIHRPNLGNETEDRDSDTDTGTQRAFVSTGAYKKEFSKYIHGAENRAALSVSADGVLIPQGFQDTLEIVRKAYGQMRENCTIITTDSGNSLPYPVMSDVSNSGTWLAEAATMNATSPTFTNVGLGAALLSSDQVLVSVQALQDFAFNPERFLAEAFGIRLGRGTNKAYTIGDGTSTYGGITGLLPALIAAGGRSVRLVGGFANSGNSGDTNLNSLGTDDFDALVQALDFAYRDGASFMFHVTTLDKLRMLKDRYGRPLWNVNLSDAVQQKILGYPYIINNDMPQLGAGLNPIIFGQFKKYLVRDVLGITAVRFNELYMASHQIGFAAFLRTWGQLLQPLAFVYGNTSAS